MFLIFDTETTGFIAKDADVNAPNQARIMQLAFIQLDEQLNEVSCFNSPLRLPDNCIISDGAMAAHGLTREYCNKFGLPVEAAITILTEKISQASHIICHNIPFDLGMAELEIERLNWGDYRITTPWICTMRLLTSICQLPHKNGRKSMFGQPFKWPTLQEAHLHCFGVPFDSAHDALADVRTTGRLFKFLVEGEHIPSLSSAAAPSRGREDVTVSQSASITNPTTPSSPTQPLTNSASV